MYEKDFTEEVKKEIINNGYVVVDNYELFFTVPEPDFPQIKVVLVTYKKETFFDGSSKYFYYVGFVSNGKLYEGTQLEELKNEVCNAAYLIRKGLVEEKHKNITIEENEIEKYCHYVNVVGDYIDGIDEYNYQNTNKPSDLRIKDIYLYLTDKEKFNNQTMEDFDNLDVIVKRLKAKNDILSKIKNEDELQQRKNLVKILKELVARGCKTVKMELDAYGEKYQCSMAVEDLIYKLKYNNDLTYSLSMPSSTKDKFKQKSRENGWENIGFKNILSIKYRNTEYYKRDILMK